jgi:serine/threonine protein kinase
MREDETLPDDRMGAGRAAQPPSSTEQIGPYRLLQKLGEGGMGEVWLAQQSGAVRRQVALKIIKRGMDSKQVVARFEAERQALAVMDHPCVAKVFDAGTTPRGRPFFVMEYVQGIPITDYSDRDRLSTRDRLELFVDVCEGIQHAHQKAIIHRDIKPSNILVATRDDAREPKIIDFGIAKATSQRLTERTIYTQIGVLLGTPAYMSPEQAEMTPELIDTRTDVYSLGVVLYELLVGALPFDPTNLKRPTFDELRRAIREDDPSRPSVRVNTLGETLGEATRARQTDPRGLRRQLSGDLDWITMKALEKDRARRYATASGLAMDIRRYLNDEAVLARPPSATYKLRKFVRRNRVAVSAGAVVAAALLAGLVLAVAGLAQAQRERDRAIAAERAATDESEKAHAINEFLSNMLKSVNPLTAVGKDVTVREVLDRGAEDIGDSLDEHPGVRAAVLDAIGTSYYGLGLYKDAEPLLTQALEIREGMLGEVHEETRASINSLAKLYFQTGDYGEAERLWLRQRGIEEVLLGDDDEGRYRTLQNLGATYMKQERYTEAEPLVRQALEGRRRILGDRHRSTLASLNNLTQLYNRQGREIEATVLARQLVEGRKATAGPQHPRTLTAMINLANLLSETGRITEAVAVAEEALAGLRDVYDDRHQHTLKCMSRLAYFYTETGRLDDAESLLVEALKVQAEVLTERHQDTVISQITLGLLYRAQGRYDRAEAQWKQTLEATLQRHGAHNRQTLNIMGNLADLYHTRGRDDEARRMMVDVLAERRRLAELAASGAAAADLPAGRPPRAGRSAVVRAAGERAHRLPYPGIPGYAGAGLPRDRGHDPRDRDRKQGHRPPADRGHDQPRPVRRAPRRLPVKRKGRAQKRAPLARRPFIVAVNDA